MISACPLSELPPGEAIRVDTDPPIAVFHTEEGELFALDDTCSHQQASLADGWIEDCHVECPLHAGRGAALHEKAAEGNPGARRRGVRRSRICWRIEPRAGGYPVLAAPPD